MSASALSDDCSHFRPVAGSYSPYGVLYGFSSDLIEHMALKTLQPDTKTRFALEDVFVSGDEGGEKLAWVTGWRKLPHITPEMAKLFEYPQKFAEEIFERIEHALRERVSDRPLVQTGRLVIVPGDDPQAEATHRAEAYDEAQLLSDRREGRCLLSYKTSDGWVAVSKNILTDVLGTGRDVKIPLPPEAAAVLKLVGFRLTFAP